MARTKIGAYGAAVFAIIVCGLVPRASAQASYDELISEARTLSYNVKFDEAESLFAAASRLSPSRPQSYFGIAQIRLWTFLGTENPSDFSAFNKASDRAVFMAQHALDADPHDYRATFLLGELYLNRTLAEVTAHSFLAAFWNVRSAYGYFEKTLELNPKFYSAYRGVGEIHYFLNLIPGAAKWILPLAGLSADKAKGFSEIRLAYQEGTVDKVEATLSLAQVYETYLAEYDSAEALMRNLVTEFPNNPMFNYHLAVVLLKETKLHEAEHYLDAVLRMNDPTFIVLNNLSIFLKGDVYFKLNEFSKAIKYNEIFLNRTKGPDYTGITNYRLAISYRAIGKLDSMRKCLVRAKNGNSSIYDDSYADRQSEKFLKAGISRDELKLIEMRNDLAAGKFEEVYSILIPAMKNIHDINLQAEGFTILSEAAVRLGKFAEGLKYAESSDTIDPEDESWVRPRSWYLTAACDYHFGYFDAARTFLKKAAGTDAYERDDRFSAAVNNLERKLEKDKN